MYLFRWICCFDCAWRFSSGRLVKCTGLVLMVRFKVVKSKSLTVHVLAGFFFVFVQELSY